MKKILLYSVLILTLVVAGCKSQEPATDLSGVIDSIPLPVEHNVTIAPLRSTILDWNNRNMGEDANPGWLQVLVKNNRQDLVRQVFSLPDSSVIKIGFAERSNREEARVLADLNFASQVAFELRRVTDAAAAQNLSEGDQQIYAESTTAARNVETTGGSKLFDFWQLIEKEDNGVRTRSYLWYSVYAFRGDIWTQLTARYLYDVVGQIPLPRVQQQVASLHAEIDRTTARGEERSDAQFYQELELMSRQVDNIQEQEMARINQQTAQTAVIARAARAQAEADRAAIMTAYRWGDPATAAALAVTANDTDWVRALATIAAIEN